MAARDERIFVCLAAGCAAGAFVGLFRHLGVIYLEIRRESHLRSLQKGDISLSLDGHHKGSRLMGHEGILAQLRRNGKITHSAAERSRGS